MSIYQAMILAAGKGTRMRPLTLTTPKPLIMVAGKPLIVWHIERLKHSGIQKIIINAGYLSEKLVEFFAHQDFGVQIVLSIEEGEPLETAGGIKKALHDKLLDDAPFLVVNGDVWTDAVLPTISLSADWLAHLWLVDNPEHNPAGDFVLHDGLVYPKDGNQKGLATLTFAGLSVMSPRLFDDVKVGEIYPLAPLLRQAMANNAISGQVLQGKWVDVGTIERLTSLEQDLLNQKI